MKTIALLSLLAICLLQAVSSFTVGPSTTTLRTSVSTSSATQLHLFGAPKDDGKPGDYVCNVSITTHCFDYLHIIEEESLCLRPFLLLSTLFRTADTSLQRAPRRGRHFPTTILALPAVHQSDDSKRYPRDRLRGRLRWRRAGSNSGSVKLNNKFFERACMLATWRRATWVENNICKV